MSFEPDWDRCGWPSKHLSVLSVVSEIWVSVSSEQLLDDWESEDFELDDTPNIALKMLHFRFAGGCRSEDEVSVVEEVLSLFFLGGTAGSGGAGGTTRSKETNKLAGDI